MKKQARAIVCTEATEQQQPWSKSSSLAPLNRTVVQANTQTHTLTDNRPSIAHWQPHTHTTSNRPKKSVLKGSELVITSNGKEKEYEKSSSSQKPSTLWPTSRLKILGETKYANKRQVSDQKSSGRQSSVMLAKMDCRHGRCSHVRQLRNFSSKTAKVAAAVGKSC